MKTHWIPREFAYDGTQLRSLFAYLDHGIQGDSVVAWVGPCSISFEHMVDGEDLLAQETIAGSKMLHFIIEKFHAPLFGAVALQRLFAAIQLDWMRERAPHRAADLRRSGDDLYLRLPNGPAHLAEPKRLGDAPLGSGAYEAEGKLSISIATLTPMSALIHFAVNLSNAGTPVQTACLSDVLNHRPVNSGETETRRGSQSHAASDAAAATVTAETYAREVMRRLALEVASIEEATVKVRWVK